MSDYLIIREHGDVRDVLAADVKADLIRRMLDETSEFENMDALAFETLSKVVMALSPDSTRGGHDRDKIEIHVEFVVDNYLSIQSLEAMQYVMIDEARGSASPNDLAIDVEAKAESKTERVRRRRPDQETE